MSTFEEVEKAHAEWVEIKVKAEEAKINFEKLVAEYNAANSDNQLDTIDQMLLNLFSLD